MKEAIAKLKAEMDGSKNNPYVKMIGDFLIRHLEANPQDAEKILAADKTIAKSIRAMRDAAQKNQHDGMAMLTDAEGFAVVLEYYSINGAPAAAPTTPISASVTPKPATDFNVSLEDFGL